MSKDKAERALRDTQAALLRAERLAASEELAGSLAHSINNPLTALIGTITMLKEGAVRGDPLADRALQLAIRMRDVVARSLDPLDADPLELLLEVSRRRDEALAPTQRLTAMPA